MKNFLQVMLFSLITIGLFAGYSNFGIPKIEPAPPPVAETFDLASMTMPQFIALGDKLYKGKGTCTLCHNSMGRAPMLNTIGTVGPQRLADSRYQGAATDIETYLYESMVKPSAFVVAGFGKAGSQDSESPMPDVTGGAIDFSEAETIAVIAYLQDIGGAEVTVTIPDDPEGKTTDTKTDTEQEKQQASTEPRKSLDTPQAIMANFSCIACHKVDGAGGELGPDLNLTGAQKDENYIRRAILDPNAEIAEGYAPIMPPVYGDQMTAKELELLVNYLARLK